MNRVHSTSTSEHIPIRRSEIMELRCATPDMNASIWVDGEQTPAERLKEISEHHAAAAFEGVLYGWCSVLTGQDRWSVDGKAGETWRRAQLMVDCMDERMVPALEARNAPGTAKLIETYDAIRRQWAVMVMAARACASGKGANKKRDQYILERAAPLILKIGQLAADLAGDTFAARIESESRGAWSAYRELATRQVCGRMNSDYTIGQTPFTHGGHTTH
jgi:hypothetical protein